MNWTVYHARHLKQMTVLVLCRWTLNSVLVCCGDRERALPMVHRRGVATFEKSGAAHEVLSEATRFAFRWHFCVVLLCLVGISAVAPFVKHTLMHP